MAGNGHGTAALGRSVPYGGAYGGNCNSAPTPQRPTLSEQIDQAVNLACSLGLTLNSVETRLDSVPCEASGATEAKPVDPSLSFRLSELIRRLQTADAAASRISAAL